MKKWIHAARLRTLPLSISGIVLGSLLAAADKHFDYMIFALAMLTTVLFQILSNFANDYGDGVKGTDTHRTGEKRAVASGEISAQTMKNAIKFLTILSAISATSLLALAFLPHHIYWFLIFITMGIGAIWAAIYYTVGPRAYGYRALGDLFVFMFFGLLAVIGTYSLFYPVIDAKLLLPAAAIGLLSTAVLNLNNMRDIPQDKRAGKITIAVKLGLFYAKFYHAFLLFVPFILSFIYVILLKHLNGYKFLFLALLIPAVWQMLRISNVQEYADLDAELKKTALLTLAFALLLGIGVLLA